MRRARATGWCGVALAALLGCAEPSAGGRVLIVGLDGASPRLVKELMAAGRLPNLERLAREGTWGPLHSLLPLLSPPIWTTIATGKTPQHHGVLNWTYKDASGVDRLYTGAHRKGAALWNIASNSGRTACTVQWWMTYPPEVVRGLVVSDHTAQRAGWPSPSQLFGGVVETAAATVYPAASEADAVAAYRDPPDLPGLPADAFSPAELFRLSGQPPGEIPDYVQSFSGFLAKAYDYDRAGTAIALAAEAELRPDLLMIVLPAIDRASHLFWLAYEPLPDSGTPEALRVPGREMLFRTYELADTMVGLLLERFGPDDLVLVISDHGFEAISAESGAGHVSALAQDGIVFARGPGIAAGARASGVWVHDITPTVLTWWGLPTAEDMDGNVASFLDRRSTSAVQTYDDLPIERVASGESGGEEKILEELETLGYVD